jgi:four helix bundle protein
VETAEYDAWERLVPATVRDDPLWRMASYRLALYLSDLSWGDVTRLSADRRTQSLADQLYRAIGSVGANIAEGYSRGTGRDRARFYEYALGSARESRDWYFKARHILGEDVVLARLQLLASEIRLILKMLPTERSLSLREDGAEYGIMDTESEHSDVIGPLEATALP